MADIRDYTLLRSKAGNMEVIPLQAEDADTAEPMALKGRNGALLVDLIGVEEVTLNLPEGTSLAVEVQNEDPIPVSFETPQEIAVPDGISLPVTVGNTEPIPVDLPAEKVVDVLVTNETAIPVSLPETDLGVQVNNASAIPVSFDSAQDVNVAKLVPAGQTVQIASAGSLSASFNISGITAFGVGVPYGTEGVYLSLKVSIDDTAWFTLPERLPFVADEAGENYACNGAGVGLIELLAPWKYCKIQTLDTDGAVQVQAANRDLTVVMR